VNSAEASVRHDRHHVAGSQLSAECTHNFIDISNGQGGFILGGDLFNQTRGIEHVAFLSGPAGIKNRRDNNIVGAKALA